MKVSQEVTKVIEVGPEDLVNVTKLIIVLNPGNGLEPIILNFDQSFTLISDQLFSDEIRPRRPYKLKKRADKAGHENLEESSDVKLENDSVEVNSDVSSGKNHADKLKDIAAEQSEESIGETFIKSVTEKDSDFLPKIPCGEKSFPFRNTKIVPYTMGVTLNTLDEFVRKFIYRDDCRKKFENKIYAFFIENDLGKKFEFRVLNAWHAGLWMVLYPYGFKEANGGKITFRLVEFAFCNIRKQLEQRVTQAHGHLPLPRKPAATGERKKYY